MILGQVQVRAAKSLGLTQRKTTLVVITQTTYLKETGTQEVVSLDCRTGSALFPKAGSREITSQVGNHYITVDSL